MVVETVLAIAPGNLRVPKVILDPPTKRCGVGAEYPTTLLKNCIAQLDDTGELDLCNTHRSRQPSLLTPMKVVAQ